MQNSHIQTYKFCQIEVHLPSSLAGEQAIFAFLYTLISIFLISKCVFFQKIISLQELVANLASLLINELNKNINTFLFLNLYGSHDFTFLKMILQQHAQYLSASKTSAFSDGIRVSVALRSIHQLVKTFLKSQQRQLTYHCTLEFKYILRD